MTAYFTSFWHVFWSKNAYFCTFFDSILCLKSTIWAACSIILFYFTMGLCHMANQSIRGCETHTTNLADRTCDDDLFSFIFKKSHENRWLFLIKNVQKWLSFTSNLLAALYLKTLFARLSLTLFLLLLTLPRH